MKENISPALSVIMVTPQSYETCRKTISFLRQQTARDKLEIIIVAPLADGLDLNAAELECFACYQVVTVGTLHSNGYCIAAGIRAARSTVVVYGEEHSYPEPPWAERLIARHQEAYAAVGCAMGNANPNTLTSWAHFYGQFGPVVEPVHAGPATYLAGHHTSYKRAVLLEYRERLAQLMDNECALHQDLRARGHVLYLESVVSQHVNISRWRAYCLLDFMGQRGFAAARADSGRWSKARCWFYAAASPLIPFVRSYRIGRDLKRTGRLRALAPQIFFIIFPALVCGMVGEALGYLWGDSPATYRRKIDMELNRYAYVAEQDRATQKNSVTL
jgi:hypothetical protein